MPDLSLHAYDDFYGTLEQRLSSGETLCTVSVFRNAGARRSQCPNVHISMWIGVYAGIPALSEGYTSAIGGST